MKRTIECKAELKLIRSEAEYENALRTVSPYFDNEPELGTPEADDWTHQPRL